MFMEIVKKMCLSCGCECRNLNLVNEARKLMNIVNIPSNAKISEIPLCKENQVEILLTMPGDNNYYALSAGHWLNGSERLILSIVGTVKRSNGREYYDFFLKDKEISLDYFDKKADVENKQVENKQIDDVKNQAIIENMLDKWLSQKELEYIKSEWRAFYINPVAYKNSVVVDMIKQALESEV